MASLTANSPQKVFLDGADTFADIPQKAALTIFEGAAVSMVGGYARPLTAAVSEKFAGFAVAASPQPTTGTQGVADGDISVRVQTRGRIQLPVAAGGTLANSQNDEGLTVYATDDHTFTGSNAGNAVAVGKIEIWVSAGVYVVIFESDQVRSI